MHLLTLLSLTSAAMAAVPAPHKATIPAKPAETVKLPSRSETTPFSATTWTNTVQLGDSCGTSVYGSGTDQVVYEYVCKPEPTNTCAYYNQWGSQCQQATCTNPPINFSTVSCPSNYVQSVTKTQYGTAGCLTYKCNACPTVDCWCNLISTGGPYTLEWYTNSYGCRTCRCVPVSLPTKTA